MPPNSTQNLNAKLSRTRVGRQGNGGKTHAVSRRPSRASVSATKIVGGPSSYRGGYHLTF